MGREEKLTAKQIKRIREGEKVHAISVAVPCPRCGHVGIAVRTTKAGEKVYVCTNVPECMWSEMEP